MNYNNLQLREKTFIDFTADKSVIKEIIGDKEDVAFFLSHLDENNRMLTFMQFADIVKDRELAAAIEKEFDGDWSLLHNE